MSATELNSVGAVETRVVLIIVVLAVILFLLLPTFVSGQTPAVSSTAASTGTLSDLHSDKRVVQSGRWFLVREFTVDFAVRDAKQIYCGEITTADATEAHDLIDSGGQPVQVEEKGRDLLVTLRDGRKIKGHRLSPDKCPHAG